MILIWAGVITWWERQHPWGRLMVLFEDEDITLFILSALVVRCHSQRFSLGFCFMFVLRPDDISDVISSSFYLAGSLMNSFIWCFLLSFIFFLYKTFLLFCMNQNTSDLCFGTHLWAFLSIFLYLHNLNSDHFPVWPAAAGFLPEAAFCSSLKSGLLSLSSSLSFLILNQPAAFRYHALYNDLPTGKSPLLLH